MFANPYTDRSVCVQPELSLRFLSNWTEQRGLGDMPIVVVVVPVLELELVGLPFPARCGWFWRYRGRMLRVALPGEC